MALLIGDVLAVLQETLRMVSRHPVCRKTHFYGCLLNYCLFFFTFIASGVGLNSGFPPEQKEHKEYRLNVLNTGLTKDSVHLGSDHPRRILNPSVNTPFVGTVMLVNSLTNC